MKRSWLLSIFLTALTLRLIAAITLNFSGELFSGLSRDSVNYHKVGVQIARSLDFVRAWDPRDNWTDDAWFRVIGYIYYWFGPYPLLIQIFNAVLGSLAAVMTARMAWAAYGDARVAFFSGWLIAVFPSFVYFNSLLLKDAASLFLIATLGWATVMLRQHFTLRYIIIVFACLIGFLGIREYFFFVGAALVMLSLLPIFGRSNMSTRSLIAMVIAFAGLSWFLGYGVLGYDFFTASRYTDLEYINTTRQSLSRGSGAIGGAGWGQGVLSDIENALTGIYYFLFSVDPLDVGSSRQLLALPETLVMLLAIRPMWRGLVLTWKYYRATAIALLFFGLGVLMMYVSTTTNIGALYRWRMQAFPFLFTILAAGLLVEGSARNPMAKFMHWVTRRTLPVYPSPTDLHTR